jgi:parvulin-like peptidyl-prolyl isomerase
MMKKHGFALCVVILTFMAPIAFAATELAKINTTTITLEDFNKRYQENRRLLQMRSPSKKMLLDEIIKRELAVQEARKIGLDKDPEVQERINTVLYYALLEKKLGKQVEEIFVTDDDAKRFYDRNPEMRTSHIFVPLSPEASDDDAKIAYNRLKKIYDDNVASGKMTFAEAAQRFSEGPSAPMGGDIDYQTKDKLEPAYYEAALKLKPGKVSPIIRTQFGYHIIRLTAVRAWEDADKGQVKRLVFEEKRNNLFTDYINKLRASSKVSVRNDLLKE